MKDINSWMVFRLLQANDINIFDYDNVHETYKYFYNRYYFSLSLAEIRFKTFDAFLIEYEIKVAKLLKEENKKKRVTKKKEQCQILLMENYR